MIVRMPRAVCLRKDLFILSFLFLILLSFALPCNAQRVVRVEGAPESEHEWAGRFFNPGMETKTTFVRFLRWVSSRAGREEWVWVESEPGPPPPERVYGDTLRITFVNHATFLIQTAGVNLLTDPIWSQRCSPVEWAGPKRFRDPGIRFEDLPPIDIVLISHNHFDHMDEETLQRLVERDSPAILAGLRTGEDFHKMGIEGAIELDWWDRVMVDSLAIVFVPAQHSSARSSFARDRTLWGGFVLELASGPLYFAGDTGFGPLFKDVRRVFGPIRVSLLPIGAFLPQWFMGPVHMSPAEAVKAHQILESDYSIATHFGTFPLADDGMHEPLDSLAVALQTEQIPDSVFRVISEGSSWMLIP